MSVVKIQNNWNEFLRYYGRQNLDRPTRVGLFDVSKGATNDYWLENGLPFRGLDLDIENGKPVLEIMLEGLTHVVRDVKTLRPIYAWNGDEEGMDVITADGTTTVLRFDKR